MQPYVPAAGKKNRARGWPEVPGETVCDSLVAEGSVMDGAGLPMRGWGAILKVISMVVRS